MVSFLTYALNLFIPLGIYYRMPNAIVIVGRPGSGKAVCAGYLKEFLPDTQIINLGSIVRERVLSEYGNTDRQTMQEASVGIRKALGKDIIAAMAVQMVDRCKKYAVFVGVRDIAELKRIQREFDTVIVAIQSPSRQRYDRLIKRNRSDDSKDVKQLAKRDVDEDTWSKIDAVIETADIKLMNDGTLTQLKTAVRQLAKTLQ